MPTFFQTRPGSVAKLEDPALQCTAQLMDLRPGIKFETERSIVTRIMLAQAANVQFMHTLGNQIYIYTFGDRIGELSLSGLSFACQCPDGDELGAEKIYLWYKAQRVSKRRSPVTVKLGSEVIEGFVVGFSGDLVDTSLNLFQWNVTMRTLPES